MAQITASFIGADNTTFSQVLGTGTFDSYLTKSYSPQANCTLKILVRVFLKVVLPRWEIDSLIRQIAFNQRLKLEPNTSYGYYPDYDKKPHLIKSWTPHELDEFVVAFASQASEWNRKFWLMPPDDFSLFDFQHGQSTFRPNIACEFKLDFKDEKNSHATVKAVNIYDTKQFFRSDSGTYVSEARHLSQVSMLDAKSVYQTHNDYSTIVHEVGHLLGLPHIGETRRLPHCTLAIALDRVFPNDAIGAIYRGGSGGHPCYGGLASYGDADNIMGAGNKFAPDNAKPWLDRLPHHIRTPIDLAKWKVSMTEVPPMSLIGFK